MKQWQIIIFSIIALADLTMVYLEMPRNLTKPLIMISLFGFSFMQLEEKRIKNVIFFAALFFAFCGDVFLLKSGDTFFMFGLGSFLIMQILYCYIFYTQKMIGVHKRKWPVLVLLIILILFLVMFIPQMGSLKIPVTIYTVSIVLMTILAVLRWKSAGYWWVLIGAIFFMISDGVLGVNRFASPIAGGGLIVMATYCIAQCCIVHGQLLVLRKL